MSTTTTVLTPPPRAEARYSIFPARARDLAHALVEGLAFTIALSLVGWLALLLSGPAAITALAVVAGATCWGVARSARMIWQVTIGDRATARIIARRPTFAPFYFGADLLRACATAGAASLVCASVIVTAFARHASGGGLPTMSALRLLTHAEATFAWQMLDLIPLIDAPSTLGWNAPHLVRTPVSGVALMVFKLVVVALVLRLVAFVYEHSLKCPDPITLNRGVSWDLWQDVEAYADPDGFLQRRRAFLAGASEALNQRPPVLGGNDTADAGAHRQTPPTVPESRYARDAIRRRAAWRVAVNATSVVMMIALWIEAAHWSRLWQPLGIAGLALIFLIWRVAGTDGALRFLLCAPEIEIHGLFRWVLLSYRVAVTMIVTVLVAISTAALWRVGQGTSMQGGHDTVILGQATDFYLWHVADAIPGLDVPRTLGWHLTRAFADPTSRVLLLLYKIFALVPLLALLAALARRFASTDAFEIHRRPSREATADANPEAPSAESRV